MLNQEIIQAVAEFFQNATAEQMTANFFNALNLDVDSLKVVKNSAAKSWSSHADYKKSTPSASKQARKVAERTIMDQVFGLNLAARKFVELVKNDTIKPAELCDDERGEFNQSQFNWVTNYDKSRPDINRILWFMTTAQRTVVVLNDDGTEKLNSEGKKVRVQKDGFTPREIMTAVLTASQMKPTEFANSQRAYEDSKKAKAAAKRAAKLAAKEEDQVPTADAPTATAK